MPNKPVQAAAEGLPEINRRRLLLGLAAASTAAAVSAPIPAAEAAVVVSENPELIRLADELPAVYDRYFEAWHADRAIKDKWYAVWPLAPDEISKVGTRDPWEVSEGKERSFEGGFLWRKGEKFPRIVTEQAWSVETKLCAAKRGQKKNDTPASRSEVARLSNLLQVVRKYEDECHRIKTACHDEYTAGWEAKNAAAEAVCKSIGAIMEQPDQTMAGLLIKAEALVTFSRMTERDQTAGLFQPNKWHGQIAASTLRHAKGGLA